MNLQPSRRRQKEELVYGYDEKQEKGWKRQFFPIIIIGKYIRDACAKSTNCKNHRNEKLLKFWKFWNIFHLKIPPSMKYK